MFVSQTNERQLSWDDSAARRLIKVHVARKLDCDIDYVEGRIQQLGVLLPDLVGKLERMKADLVLEYVANLEVGVSTMTDDCIIRVYAC